MLSNDFLQYTKKEELRLGLQFQCTHDKQIVRDKAA